MDTSTTGMVAKPAPPQAKPAGKFRLNFSRDFRDWLLKHRLGLALSTYETGKVVLVGAGKTNYAASVGEFRSAMALLATENGFYLSMQKDVWRFENGLSKGQIWDRKTDLASGEVYFGADRLYMPRQSHVTGGADVHDLAVDGKGRLLAVVTLYNCVAVLDHRGNFSPIWRPRFIDAMVNQDRCHLNGFCLKDGRLAYVTLIGPSNVLDGWRENRAGSGQVVATASHDVVADGLAMPHSPRLHRNRLWVLESGSGWFGWVDLKKRKFERLAWLPGFLRGLRFIDNYAIVGLSKARNKLFNGLPLQGELEQRGREAICGAQIVNLDTGEIEHWVEITGSIQEIYDVMVLPDTIEPRMVGTSSDDARRLIFPGPDQSGPYDRAKRR